MDVFATLALVDEAAVVAFLFSWVTQALATFACSMVTGTKVLCWSSRDRSTGLYPVYSPQFFYNSM